MTRASVSRRILRVVACTIFAFAVLAPAAGAVAGDEPPRGGNPAPEKKPLKCADAPKTTAGDVWGEEVAGAEKLCGTNASETFHPGPGDWVYGNGGNDRIWAANGNPNKLWGGPGSDWAQIDPKGDTAVGVEKAVKKSRALSARFLFQSALWRLGVDVPAYTGTFECLSDSYQGRWIRVMEEPTMRAFDVTKAVDWQQVAWSALVFRQADDGTWKLLAQSTWRWDLTYDESVEAFPGNYWRSYKNGKRVFLGITRLDPGAYRVGLWFHWYSSEVARPYDLLVWGGRHYGDFEDGTHSWCKFPV